MLKIKYLSENAHIPTKGSLEAAGYDLYSAYDYIIEKHKRSLIKTDISIDVPYGTYGRIAPRSGLALKYGIDVFAGVIDKDYTGNIGVVLYNSGDEDFYIKKGDRIAQLILEKIQIADLFIVSDIKNDYKKRGDAGFGSTN